MRFVSCFAMILSVALMTACGGSSSSNAAAPSQNNPSSTAPQENLNMSIADVNSTPSAAEIVVPVALTSENSATPQGAQFDIAYDTSRFEIVDVRVGTASSGASKSVSYSNKANSTRVMIFGMNKNIIGDGTIAEVVFRPKAGTPAGRYGVSLDRVRGSSKLKSIGGTGAVAAIILQ